MAVGLLRAGLPGALCAWLGFTIPSALLMIAFAYGVGEVGSVEAADWLHGLKLAAVAIVALAVWSMARALSPDRERGTIAIVAAILMLSWQAAGVQVLVIVLGGIAGWMLYSRASLPIPDVAFDSRVGRNLAATAWVAFFALLIGLPLAASLFDSQALNLFDSFYRTGSLVFGGGHVVLPLLEREVVAPGWVTQDDFLAGYGAAQAVPGPLFTFAAYLGAVMGPAPNGWAGAILCLIAMFLPAFLLTIGPLPFWDQLRARPWAQSILRGVNAAVVGLLLAALYNPVWTAGITNAQDFALAVAAFLLLFMWQAPPWLVVVLCAVAAAALSALPNVIS
jgi:chromate transporter